MPKRDAYEIPTGDATVDRALIDIRRIQRDSRVEAPVLLEDIELANGTRTVVRHGLARKYRAVFVSPPMGATATGRIVEEEPDDRSREIWLTATGHGGVITVALLVYV